MNLRGKKRLAASLLKVGTSKIWIDPEGLEDVETAITRSDVRRLIEEGIIKRIEPHEQSHGRRRVQIVKKRKGLGSGPASRQGSQTSIVGRKDRWMLRVRGQRRRLRALRERRMISTSTYRKLYGMVKGGAFHTQAELDRYIRARGLGRRAFG